MKLRYYLRGLGIGILVTAFIMMIVRGSGKGMSDAEIRARAAELGMVDINSQVLSDLPQGSTEGEGDPSPENKEAEPSPGEQADPVGTGADNWLSGLLSGSEPTSGDDKDGDPEAESGNLPAGSEDPDAEGSRESDEEPLLDVPDGSNDASGEQEEPSQEPEGPPANTVRFTIRGGTGSEGICRDLAEAGLVENASDFDLFLCDNGYSQRLRSGTFDIPLGASYEEIARLITGGVR